MGFMGMFGLGGPRIIAGGLAVPGLVTGVKECRWYRVKLRPVCRGPGDVAHPHIITFAYEAGGRRYTGARFISWTLRSPAPGAEITVYYDGSDPRKYAVLMDMPPFSRPPV